MGYGYYQGEWPEHPAAGYMVIATCDKRGCDEQIDRGLGYICGDEPHWGLVSDEPGCGRYYCGKHLGWVGPRGGCPHRGKRAWGKTISDLVPNKKGKTGIIFCLDPIGHPGKHAWARKNVMDYAS